MLWFAAYYLQAVELLVRVISTVNYRSGQLNASKGAEGYSSVGE